MKSIKILAPLALLLALAACDDKPAPFGDFENRVSIEQSSEVSTIFVKQTTLSDERSFYATTPKPVDRDVTLLFAADESRVADYNRRYGASAAMLPADFYEIEGAEALIAAGTNRSEQVTVRFHDLDRLDTEALHVLPVSMSSSDGLARLASARTVYYVLQGAAIINVVATLSEGNYIAFDEVLDGESASCKVLDNLEAFTLEALIRCRSTVLDAGIKTVMGIEGHCLIRISDNGLAPNQLQVVLPTPYGTSNFSEAATCLIPAEKWTHIALTCDVASGRMILYIDGQVAIDKSGNTFKAVNLGTPYVNPNREVYGFNIGYSYTSGRELDGDITECRVWNVVRSQEEIAANVYEVDPGSEGLVAYWKFDEATGETIRDHTGNGNSGKAHAALKWTSVSLPEAAGTPEGGADEN